MLHSQRPSRRARLRKATCFVSALLLVGPQLRAQCPQADDSETQYEKVTLMESSNARPALAVFNGSLYLAWNGTDRHLNVLRSSDGLHFQDKITLAERSRGGITSPALTVFNGSLYLAWTGADDHLNILSSSDGSNFSNKITLGETSLVGPGLAAFAGKLYLGWNGTNFHINVISSPDGSTFGNKITLDDTADDSPGLSPFNGTLYLSWTEPRGGGLEIASSADGTSFGNEMALPEASYRFFVGLNGETFHTGPALASFTDNLYVSWTGKDKRLNLLSSSDGADFPSTGKITFGETSERSPSLAEFNGRLYLAWRGLDSRLNVMRLTGLQ